VVLTICYLDQKIGNVARLARRTGRPPSAGSVWYGPRKSLGSPFLKQLVYRDPMVSGVLEPISYIERRDTGRQMRAHHCNHLQCADAFLFAPPLPQQCCEMRKPGWA